MQNRRKSQKPLGMAVPKWGRVTQEEGMASPKRGRPRRKGDASRRSGDARAERGIRKKLFSDRQKLFLHDRNSSKPAVAFDVPGIGSVAARLQAAFGFGGARLERSRLRVKRKDVT